MKIDFYQVDAFTSELFKGNPAAVCPLQQWLPDEMMVQIAAENNLSETAFFIPQGDSYALRWFTPEAEVDLCGHATLATAHVLFQHLKYPHSVIRFTTKSGLLQVAKTKDGYCMDFPAAEPVAIAPPERLSEALGAEPDEVFAAYDYIAVFANEQRIKGLSPDFNRLSQLDLRGVLATAPAREVDFVSRCFFPKLQVNEDPVTGSAHCELAPLWSTKSGKTKLIAKQLSKRSGIIKCEVKGDRVLLSGTAVDYLKGQIII